MFCVREVNINTLVKVFASRIYEHYHINRSTGSLSFEQFGEWIKEHPKLYDSYYKGFHNYIWEYWEGAPLYRKNIPEKKSAAVRLVSTDGKEVRVTAMLINTTLMLFCDDDG